MSKKKRLIRWAFGSLALWLAISSCGFLNTTSVSDTRTDTQNVELGSAEVVRVQIHMGAGELSVTGDANSLLDATFRYNVAHWQPRVNYTINGSRGELVVDHQGEAIPVGGALVMFRFSIGLLRVPAGLLRLSTGLLRLS